MFGYSGTYGNKPNCVGTPLNYASQRHNASKPHLCN